MTQMVRKETENATFVCVDTVPDNCSIGTQDTLPIDYMATCSGYANAPTATIIMTNNMTLYPMGQLSIMVTVSSLPLYN